MRPEHLRRVLIVALTRGLPIIIEVDRDDLGDLDDVPSSDGAGGLNESNSNSNSNSAVITTTTTTGGSGGGGGGGGCGGGRGGGLLAMCGPMHFPQELFLAPPSIFERSVYGPLLGHEAADGAARETEIETETETETETDRLKTERTRPNMFTCM